jgi:hypothetical protein
MKKHNIVRLKAKIARPTSNRKKIVDNNKSKNAANEKSTTVKAINESPTTVTEEKKLPIEEKKEKKQISGPPLYLVGWGWNDNRRAGNITEEEITIPRQVNSFCISNQPSPI